SSLFGSGRRRPGRRVAPPPVSSPTAEHGLHVSLRFNSTASRSPFSPPFPSNPCPTLQPPISPCRISNLPGFNPPLPSPSHVWLSLPNPDNSDLAARHRRDPRFICHARA